jgi:hypothetical protein
MAEAINAAWGARDIPGEQPFRRLEEAPDGGWQGEEAGHLAKSLPTRRIAGVPRPEQVPASSLYAVSKPMNGSHEHRGQARRQDQ